MACKPNFDLGRKSETTTTFTFTLSSLFINSIVSLREKEKKNIPSALMLSLVVSLSLTNLGVDLDLAVRRDQEIFSVCLFDRGHCL